MPLGHSGAPRITQNNADSRLRRLGRSLTGGNGTPFRHTLFSTDVFQLEASPVAANTNARRPVMDIFSAEFKDSDGAVVNSCVTAGFWNDCGFIEIRCAADNTLVWGVNNTFGGGPGAVVYMGSTGFMKADNTAFIYNEDLEQLKIYQNTTNTTPMMVLEQDSTGHATYSVLSTGSQGYTWGLSPIFGTDYWMMSPGNTAPLVFADIRSALVMNPDGAFGIGALPTTGSEKLKVRPPLNTTTTQFSCVKIESPNKTVDVNSNNVLLGLQVGISPLSYDIGAGVTDSGSREGLRFEAFVANTNFEGTLNKQIAAFLRHGINIGGGTVSNSIGVLIQTLNDTGTITQAWGIYQINTIADNYFAGNTFVGASPTVPISTLDVGGSLGFAITEVNVNTTLDATHCTLLVNTNSADRVVTLPTAVSSIRRAYNIKKIDASSNTVTIDGNGAETIDGSANAVISSQNDSITVQSDGTAWWII